MANPDDTLLNAKVSLEQIAANLMEIRTTCENANNAESLAGFLGTLLDNDTRLRELSEDMGTLLRSVRRARDTKP